MSHLNAIQSIFHALANKLNNITTRSGAIPSMLGDYSGMSKDQLTAELKKILADLDVIEKSALESGVLITALKKELNQTLGNADKTK